MSRRRSLVLSVTLLASFVGAPLSARQAAQPQLRPLGIEEALSTLSLAVRMPIDLSPDGEWVAYTLADASRNESTGDVRYRYFSRTGAFQEAAGCDIWITNVRTGESRNLTGGEGTSWGPIWSPDARHLAFFSDRGGTAHLWIWDRASGSLREVDTVIPRPFFGFAGVRWTDDSRKVLLKALPEGLTVESAADLFDEAPPAEAAKASGVTAVVFDASTPTPAADGPSTEVDRDGAAYAVRYLSDVALVDIATGAVERLARDVRAVGYWVSPDANHVAYTTVTGVRRNTQDVLYDIVLVSVADGSSRTLANDLRMNYGITVSWSPDGSLLAIATGDSQLGTPGEVFVAPVNEPGEPQKISNGEHPSISTDYRAPLWDARGEFVYFPTRDALWRASVRSAQMEHVVTVPDHDVIDVLAPANNIGRFWSPDGGRSLVVVTVDRTTRKSGFWKVDLQSKTAAPALEEEKYYGGSTLYRADVSSDARTIVYTAESATTGEDLWVTDESFRTPRRITHINPQTDNVVLGTSRLISWQKADSTTLYGALLLPAGYEEGKRYPLIVRPYAGSMLSRNVFRFGGNGAGVDNMHILTTRGYAVLLPDVPQRVGTPMRDIADAVLPGLDKAIELGIADPDRLGVTGHSYGGYSTLSLIVQSPRFKAAVSSAGPGNLSSRYGAMRPGGVAGSIGWSETGQGRMGGHIWEYRDRYIENSPLFFLDRVETPLLMVHGGIDESVRPSEPEEVFIGLRRLGKPVVYVRYDGEGHWQGTWGRENVVDYWNRMINWFDTYLGQPRTDVPPSLR
jgi:dipeptidyl aminopeptidase/acylaminoacyl peptidase